MNIDINPEKLFSQLVSGLQNYCRENNFSKVILGVSGGIDSAMTAVLAVKALGKNNVRALFLPSKFTSEESREDAFALARNLEITITEISIQEILDLYLDTLKEHLSDGSLDKAEENLQARIRANILFAFSNKFNYLVLATGNKSEILTGYFTLYGDSAGGLAPFANIYKTQVYALAKYVNESEGKELIPKRIFEKAPSAELKYNQTDQDTLPPYDELDKILRLYFDKKKSKEEIVKNGFSAETVARVIEMIKQSEFKRKQLPAGLEIDFLND